MGKTSDLSRASLLMLQIPVLGEHSEGIRLWLKFVYTYFSELFLFK